MPTAHTHSGQLGQDNLTNRLSTVAYLGWLEIGVGLSLLIVGGSQTAPPLLFTHLYNGRLRPVSATEPDVIRGHIPVDFFFIVRVAPDFSWPAKLHQQLWRATARRSGGHHPLRGRGA